MHVWLNSKDTFCLYNLIKILSNFLVSVLVLDDLQCTLMILALHHKTYSIPKSKFRKILVENTTIIAHKIGKVQLQTLKPCI